PYSCFCPYSPHPHPPHLHPFPTRRSSDLPAESILFWFLHKINPPDDHFSYMFLLISIHHAEGKTNLSLAKRRVHQKVMELLLADRLSPDALLRRHFLPRFR